MKARIIQLQNSLLGVTRYADVLLAIAVVLILSMMILPIPPFLLDLLLATNLSLSILMLVIAMYVPNILAFSTFPSLLLVTTLFRLGLNITTTRLILLSAKTETQPALTDPAGTLQFLFLSPWPPHYIALIVFW